MTPLKTMQLIHLAFCVGILLFGIVSVLVISDAAYFEVKFQHPEPIHFLAPIVAIFGIIMGGFMFNKVLGNTADAELDANSKLVRYQTAFLVKCAFLECGALMNIVASMVTYNTLFLGFAAACLMVLWLSRPTREKVVYSLNLQDPDFR